MREVKDFYLPRVLIESFASRAKNLSSAGRFGRAPPVLVGGGGCILTVMLVVELSVAVVGVVLPAGKFEASA